MILAGQCGDIPCLGFVQSDGADERNQAGFTEMMDTEAMFKKWFADAKAQRLLP